MGHRNEKVREACCMHLARVITGRETRCGIRNWNRHHAICCRIPGNCLPLPATALCRCLASPTGPLQVVIGIGTLFTREMCIPASFPCSRKAASSGENIGMAKQTRCGSNVGGGDFEGERRGIFTVETNTQRIYTVSKV